MEQTLILLNTLIFIICITGMITLVSILCSYFVLLKSENKFTNEMKKEIIKYTKY